MAGNDRFVRGKPIHGKISRAAFAELSAGQHPIAGILGCSDSRVPPELIFDQSFGDLFVMRLAGNILVPGVAGSIQYAYRHLGTSLLVVLGHEGCGAVKAALAAKFHRVQHPRRIRHLVELIKPGLVDINRHQSATEQLHMAVEANVKWSIRQLFRMPEVKRVMRERRDVLVVGAVYELTTGRVRLLSSPTSK
jgi:carbonic anhydrase